MKTLKIIVSFFRNPLQLAAASPSLMKWSKEELVLGSTLHVPPDTYINNWYDQEFKRVQVLIGPHHLEDVHFKISTPILIGLDVHGVDHIQILIHEKHRYKRSTK